jgi:hypothetical protein
VVWNQTNIEPASMPKVESELTYKRCRICHLAHVNRPGICGGSDS